MIKKHPHDNYTPPPPSVNSKIRNRGSHIKKIHLSSTICVVLSDLGFGKVDFSLVDVADFNTELSNKKKKLLIITKRKL